MAIRKVIPDGHIQTPLVELVQGRITQHWSLLLQKLLGSFALSTATKTTLTGATTAIAGPTAFQAGDRYTAIIKQDATGGRLITWGPNFATMVSADISIVALKTSIFDFVSAEDGLWYPTSAPFIEE